MALVVLGWWGFLGWVLHRADRSARGIGGHQGFGGPDGRDGHGTDRQSARAVIPDTVTPDTVPEEWVETYRSEHDG